MAAGDTATQRPLINEAGAPVPAASHTHRAVAVCMQNAASGQLSLCSAAQWWGVREPSVSEGRPSVSSLSTPCRRSSSYEWSPPKPLIRQNAPQEVITEYRHVFLRRAGGSLASGSGSLPGGSSWPAAIPARPGPAGRSPQASSGAVHAMINSAAAPPAGEKCTRGARRRPSRRDYAAAGGPAAARDAITADKCCGQRGAPPTP
ncbi:uncharacterized protein LOC126456172 [Schistocerca serialis cubense]|uniref:uncharacterized protein LOC126456172 n=1 Tax=Schistocerca serialis cubense TaxID=2023355 RepID=UPI00214F5C25|nr:uncharacterized protein LOC126456172 [Schistocerca serialis cubense]